MNNTTLLDVVLLFLFSVLALSPTFMDQSTKKTKTTVEFKESGSAVSLALTTRQIILGVHKNGSLSIDGVFIDDVQCLGPTLKRAYEKGLFDEVVLAIEKDALGKDIISAVSSVLDSGCCAIGFREIGGR